MVDYLNLRKITERHIDEIREAVNRVIDSGWYLKGEATHRFEEDYAQYMEAVSEVAVDNDDRMVADGHRGRHCHCVGCGNGLDALTLIFRAYKEMGRLEGWR